MNNNRHTGFTIIELLVTLAIAAVLFGIALPAFQDFTVQRTMATRANALLQSVAYARSEAARMGGQVSVQAINSTANANEFGPGYCVTVGDPGNCNTPLRIYEPITDATLDAVSNQDVMTFNARGLLVNTAAASSLTLCPDDTANNPGRRLTLNQIGRVSIADFTCP